MSALLHCMLEINLSFHANLLVKIRYIHQQICLFEYVLSRMIYMFWMLIVLLIVNAKWVQINLDFQPSAEMRRFYISLFSQRKSAIKSLNQFICVAPIHGSLAQVDICDLLEVLLLGSQKCFFSAFSAWESLSCVNPSWR